MFLLRAGCSLGWSACRLSRFYATQTSCSSRGMWASRARETRNPEGLVPSASYVLTNAHFDIILKVTSINVCLKVIIGVYCILYSGFPGKNRNVLREKRAAGRCSARVRTCCGTGSSMSPNAIALAHVTDVESALALTHRKRDNGIALAKRQGERDTNKNDIYDDNIMTCVSVCHIHT